MFLMITGSYDAEMDDRYPGYTFTYCGSEARVWWKDASHPIVEVIAARTLDPMRGLIPKRPPLVLRDEDALLYLRLCPIMLSESISLPFFFRIPVLLFRMYARAIGSGVSVREQRKVLDACDDIADKQKIAYARILLRFLPR